RTQALAASLLSRRLSMRTAPENAEPRLPPWARLCAAHRVEASDASALMLLPARQTCVAATLPAQASALCDVAAVLDEEIAARVCAARRKPHARPSAPHCC
ncbi:hypothetical protein Dimus_036227, partial [Dionaea muscipula]